MSFLSLYSVHSGVDNAHSHMSWYACLWDPFIYAMRARVVARCGEDGHMCREAKFSDRFSRASFGIGESDLDFADCSD